jgi:hypothetical protein
MLSFGHEVVGAKDRTLYARDAAAITALLLVPRFSVGFVRGEIGCATAAHMNLVFGSSSGESSVTVG